MTDFDFHALTRELEQFAIAGEGCAVLTDGASAHLRDAITKAFVPREEMSRQIGLMGDDIERMLFEALGRQRRSGDTIAGMIEALSARVKVLEDERDEWTVERATGQQQLDEAAAEIRTLRAQLAEEIRISNLRGETIDKMTNDAAAMEQALAAIPAWLRSVETHRPDIAEDLAAKFEAQHRETRDEG